MFANLQFLVVLVLRYDRRIFQTSGYRAGAAFVSRPERQLATAKLGCDDLRINYLAFQARYSTGVFQQPVSTLYRLVSALPRLQYLDIANTNLCASPLPDDRPEK